MSVKELIYKSNVILDGGMGTLLQQRGLAPGELPELWNIARPNEIVAIHKAYFDAGSNVVNANTFGANSIKFSIDDLDRIIGAAITNAKTARQESVSDKEMYVALDIGPLGKLLAPFGELDFEDAVAVFADTVKLGVKHGADLIYIETMNDSYETKAALLAAKENSDLPVFVSNAYSEDGKLMTGADPIAMVAMLEGMGADAIGVNCSLGPKQLIPIVKEMLRYASVPIIMKPNAGLPVCECGKTHYNVSPEEFSDVVAEAVSMGVSIVGGCCGTTPEYISNLSEKIADFEFKAPVYKEHTLVSSYTHAVEIGNKPILIGERINPTGKKRFKQALKENDMDYILGEGVTQQEKGVQILDVNVGLPDIDETVMLTNAVCKLQSVIDLPLQIDTSSVKAMEAALRRYNGKAMINSVNGKQESMEAVFPLAKKYGGLIVALTLDENGIPATSEGRVEIARNILSTAKKYGISAKNIVFDTLCMAVSADASAPAATLDSLRYIRKELGMNTVLGVSNVSFGLPSRDTVNSAFFAFALENGLSAAIINPYSVDMMKVYHSYLLLHGMDENCDGYIKFASELPQSTPSARQQTVEVAASHDVEKCTLGVSVLQDAIIKGLKERAAHICENLIIECQPLDIVNEHIIPALDTVGKGFEEKRMYLPQLLMSAEAAKSSFDVIKRHIKSTDGETEKKLKVVIATVKGDIHDIGKNIVKVLLENYGYDVVDLGRDVSAQSVVDAVISEKADICGLSALMTTTVPAMEETIKLIKEKAPNCKTVVGGAVMNQEYADRIGADKYAKDAMETVRFAEALYIKKTNFNT